MNKVKHSLNESYLRSLTEEQRLNDMKQWSASECQQYYCLNGSVFFEKLDKRVQEMFFEKYGDDNIK